MKVQMIEQPFPWDEPAPAPGYFAPPSHLIVGNEWRLIQGLRDAAATGNAQTILTEAVVTHVRQALVPDPQGFGLGIAMAFADLAVTGRRAFADFALRDPQEGGPIEAAAAGMLAASGLVGVTPALVREAMSHVLDRAYQVAWFLRAQTARRDLGWIAVSGEDDLPHRPVNVPRTAFPQHDLYFTVPGDLGEVAVQTRFTIATATEPAETAVSLPQRSLPAVLEPTLPDDDQLILFINGSDSRLEEATDLISKLVRTPDGRPTGFAVLCVDLPGSGYASLIDHTEVGTWDALVNPVRTPWGRVGFAANASTFSLLPFVEKFILRFVAALSTRLGQPGLVESRIAALVGGSLGGNLGLRLARRPYPWLRNIVAWSPGSVWRIPHAGAESVAFRIGVDFAVPEVGALEDKASRDEFFVGVFDRAIPDKTQPEQWYRTDFPAKQQDILSARFDRRETYTSQFRRWHWRISLEELLWTWQDPAVQDFQSRILLGAGTGDDIFPANIFTNTLKLAGQLTSTGGDTFFFDHAGHSIHTERPEALATKILTFITQPSPPPPPLPAPSLVHSPAATAWGRDRLDFFGVGADGHMYQQAWTGAAFGGWVNLGGQFQGSPAVCSWAPDRLDFFGVGTDGHMYQQAWTGAAFGGWVNLGGQFQGSPAVCSWAPDRLDFFGVGTDGHMYQQAWTGAAFGGWVNLGGQFQGSPAVCSWAPDRLDFFGVGTDGHMYQQAWTGAAFGGWVNLGGQFQGSPAVCSWAPDRLDFFGVGTDGHMYQQAWTGAAFGGWVNLGGQFQGSPAVCSWAPDRLDFFGVGTDGHMYQQAWTGAAFGGWVNLGGQFQGSPAVCSWAPDRLDFFGVGTDGHMYQQAWTGAAFGGWVDLGGQ